MSQWLSGIHMGYTRRGIIGSSYPKEEIRHDRGQWLYGSHKDKHRHNHDLCAPSFSRQKSQRRSFKNGGQEMRGDQHMLEQRGIPM